jgi:glycosidase
MTTIIFSGIEHKAALPYCYYDSSTQTIVLRVVSSGIKAIQSISLLYGDPYQWDKEEEQVYVWRFQETPLHQHFSGIQKTAWKTEIAVPKQRRLKYGFRIKTAAEDLYFSENGLEPYCKEALNRPHNHFFYPFVYESDSPPNPSWAAQTVWYQIFPERFCNGDPTLSPAGVEDWENAKPNYRSFFGGDLVGIKQKLPYLAQLGINGIYLTSIFQSPSTHKYDTQDYFAVDKQFGSLDDLKALVAQAHSSGIKVMLDAVFNHSGDRHPFWQDVLKNQEQSPYKDYFCIHSFPVKERYEHQEEAPYDTFAFSRMPKWNTENPAVRSYFLEVSAYWIRECDIDGWRLDVANEVSFQLWRDFSHLVRSLKKDFYITGELWHDASNWINNQLFDAVMNYPLGLAVSDYFLQKTLDAPHFTDRLITALTRYSDLHNRIAFNLLDSHDTARVLNKAKGDKSAVRNAFTMLFLLPGSPCLYYGTEIGMEGGEDPDNRRPMIWNEAQQDKDLLRFFQRLIAFRKAHQSLIARGALTYETVEQAQCWRIADEKEALMLVYAEGKALPLSSVPGTVVFTTGDSVSDTLAPYSMAVCRLPV